MKSHNPRAWPILLFEKPVQALSYDRKSTPFDQVDGIRERMQKLAELNEKLGMLGVYQLHSGHDGVGYVDSLVWDVAWMLKDINPDTLGLAYDLRHTRNDTGNSWKQAADIQSIQTHGPV